MCPLFAEEKMNIRVLIASILVLVIIVPVQAVLNVTVGDHILLPDQPGQEIILSVSGDEQVTGFNLRAQIGDGLAGQDEPVFQDIDFSDGIWDPNSYTTLGGPVSGAEQYAQASIVFTQTGVSVLGNGKILTLIIDTTGIIDGVYDLKLAGTDIGVDSAFLAEGGVEIPTNITNGSISVPHSSTVNLVMQEPMADPNGVFTGDDGVGYVLLLWSEPVIFSADDLTVTNEELNPVSFLVDGSGTEFMNITFNELLLYDRYSITIHDSVTSVETGNPVDGDNDGVMGGDAIIVMEHRQRVDCDNDNDVDLFDLAKLADKWLWNK